MYPDGWYQDLYGYHPVGDNDPRIPNTSVPGVGGGGPADPTGPFPGTVNINDLRKP